MFKFFSPPRVKWQYLPQDDITKEELDHIARLLSDVANSKPKEGEKLMRWASTGIKRHFKFISE